MDGSLPKTSVAEIFAHKIAALDPARLPAAVRRKCEDLLIDIVGLCVTARRESYIRSALSGFDDEGQCTAIGHARPLSAAGAAFINGTAAHGEDFDDTFEGGPVHAGAVIVPAVLAACERYNANGPAALLCTAPASTPLPCSARWARQPASAPRSGLARASSSMPWAMSAAWRAASSSISPKAPGPSASTRAGRRNRACAPPCSAAPASSARAPCSRACMA